MYTKYFTTNPTPAINTIAVVSAWRNSLGNADAINAVKLELYLCTDAYVCSPPIVLGKDHHSQVIDVSSYNLTLLDYISVAVTCEVLSGCDQTQIHQIACYSEYLVDNMYTSGWAYNRAQWMIPSSIGN